MSDNIRVLAITQARMGSTRFPAKIMERVQDRSLLQMHVERIKQAQLVDAVMIATTTNAGDQAILDFAAEHQCFGYAGSEDDVLDRYYQSALQHRPEWCVRVTSDCPLVDPSLMDEIIRTAMERNLDYYSNTLVEAFPDGQDIEVFKFAALEKAWCEATLTSDREHVTPFIKKNSSFFDRETFSSDNHSCDRDYNKVRLCVDEPRDLDVVAKLIEHCGFDADWMTYTTTYLEHEDIRAINQDTVRNEGYLKSLKSDDA